MISYEINFFILFLLFLIFIHSYKIKEFYIPQNSTPFLAGLIPLLLI
ncbi:hypothetical protein DRW41_22390 [Neobacillus piezotolerans]|uniref:Uncharacterized protein n=2 Tax=Bacteria TaxID=2 RepID=A0A2I0QYP0_9FLAO|nr:hypothetical protein CW751_15090 [Brumimicrobium salinarum]RDU34645.1 hypothetical protein DRW41_22390 [Neobacillus piezotolerans]